MSMAQVENAAPPPLPVGGVHFVEAARHKDLCADLRAQCFVIAPVSSAERGQLRRAIDEAVEGVLAKHGALPPGVDGESPLERSLRDQVFRARALGGKGLALVLPSLASLAHDATLDADDSGVLSAWISAAKRAPLVLVLDEADRSTRVQAPVPLTEFVGGSALSRENGGVRDVPLVDADLQLPAQPPPPILAMPRRGVMKKRARREEDEDAGSPAGHGKCAGEIDRVPETPAVELPKAHPPPETVDAAAEMDAPPPELVGKVEEVQARGIRPEPEPATRPAESPVARRILSAAECRTHAIELDKARGPKPTSVIERLYTTRYVPLLGAVARGDVDAAIKGVVDTWRANFEHSYREAFSSLRVTGKRPSMVFDAGDIAGRIARLNGARAVKLLLVDAMRFDLGERVAQRLHERLAGRAVCVERTVLWAAIPTTTSTQLALLARGHDGLRDVDPALENDAEIVRGRAVSTIRRERIGSREVMKLDLVEARIRSAGPGYEERLDTIADEVVPIVVKFVETLPPRTLLYLFGDHGFRLPASTDRATTGPATQGGLSPEEVLVPGQAWLVGGVH